MMVMPPPLSERLMVMCGFPINERRACLSLYVRLLSGGICSVSLAVCVSKSALVGGRG